MYETPKNTVLVGGALLRKVGEKGVFALFASGPLPLFTGHVLHRRMSVIYEGS